MNDKWIKSKDCPPPKKDFPIIIQSLHCEFPICVVWIAIGPDGVPGFFVPIGEHHEVDEKDIYKWMVAPTFEE